MKAVDSKLLSAILVPMLLIPLMGFGYAHWTDRVTTQVKLHVGCTGANIISYKCYSEFDDEWITKDPPAELVPPEGFSTLRISTDRAFPSWYVWIGLLIQNQGTFPVNVYEPDYETAITPPNGASLRHEEYFYGPYKRADFNKDGVWKSITGDNYLKKLDPDIGVKGGDPADPPFIHLDPAGPNKMVLWIYLLIEDGVEEFFIELEISPRFELDI